MLRVIQENEAIYNVIQARGRYICYLGAGASAEAGVKTAFGICDEIYRKLVDSELRNSLDEEQARETVEENLEWEEVSTRYVMCMRKGFAARDSRVEYFRKLLQNVRPSFCHHAVALLMGSGYLNATCLTTNFDKLIETAFMQQGRRECQPIRSDSEMSFWWPDQKRNYIVKLHGDYDTDNVLNTNEETIRISEKMQNAVRNLVRKSGMLVLGTAGNENSIRTMFDYLETAGADKVLSYGLLWGVYMNAPRPNGVLSNRDLEDLIRKRIKEGEVGKGIFTLMERAGKREEPFCLFPVWGAGNFMFNLIKATREKELIGTAELYLDREMRLWTVFKRAQLEEDAIHKHINKLREQDKKLQADANFGPGPARAMSTISRAHSQNREIEIRAVYGDITSRSMMSEPEFQETRRVVVSPEDTCLSAGGGVALRLLTKAGRYELLNELQKFSPIGHRMVAVTSGGNLPVHYVFHAATIEIQRNGEYAVSEADVCTTMKGVLDKAAALDVSTIWVPLMGAGVGPLSNKQSLNSILRAIIEQETHLRKMTVIIVIYDEKHLLPNEAIDCIRAITGPSWSVENLYPGGY